MRILRRPRQVRQDEERAFDFACMTSFERGFRSLESLFGTLGQDLSPAWNGRLVSTRENRFVLIESSPDGRAHPRVCRPDPNAWCIRAAWMDPNPKPGKRDDPPEEHGRVFVQHLIRCPETHDGELAVAVATTEPIRYTRDPDGCCSRIVDYAGDGRFLRVHFFDIEEGVDLDGLPEIGLQEIVTQLGLEVIGESERTRRRAWQHEANWRDAVFAEDLEIVGFRAVREQRPGSFRSQSWLLPATIACTSSPSIFDVLKKADAGSEADLPDDERAAARSPGLSFSPGAYDGIPVDWDEDEHVHPDGRSVASLIGALTKTNPADVDALASLYELVRDSFLLRYFPEMGETIEADSRIHRGRVGQLGRWLARHSSDREPVKLGLVLLMIGGSSDDRQIIDVLSKHDEFSFYVVYAADRLLPRSDAIALARRLAETSHGWGAIQGVLSLTEGELTDDVRSWLLHGGYRNAELGEIGVPVMRAVDLATVLAVDSVDRPVFETAGQLLGCMGNGRFGPPDYKRSAEATRSYLRLAQSQAETLDDFLAVRDILGLTNDEEADWVGRAAAGWTQETRTEIAELSRAIMTRPTWAEKARKALQDSDFNTFDAGDEVARACGINTIPYHVDRISKVIAESRLNISDDRALPVYNSWQAIAEQWSEDDIDSLLELAETALDPPTIATGPAMELFGGRDFELDLSVQVLVRNLKRFPARGSILVQSALRSRFIATRHAALETLRMWPPHSWPFGTRDALLSLLEEEPDDDLRKEIQSLIG